MVAHRFVFILLSASLTLSVIPARAVAQDAPPPLENRSAQLSGKYEKRILWMEWGPEAFARARAEDRPIFLDISATWCRWCRVMDETTYRDPRVVELINREFVPVYVDTDRRPDINDRYNQGGWPSVAVLAPTGQVLAGKTTVSADDLLALFETVGRAYRTDRERIYERLDAAEKAAREAKEEREKKQRPAPLSAEMPFRVLGAVNLFVDPAFGGYGGPDKFPLAEVMEFALYLYPKTRKFKEQSTQTAIDLTLGGMAGGLLDKEEGGFFRYSTRPDWKAPHFEKMLSTNGDLLGVYMQAGQLLGNSGYIEAGESVADYLDRVLYDKSTGAFFNSQASDENYYRLGRSSRQKAAPPPVDRVVYSDSNARAALGYLSAYRATGEGRYLSRATGVVEYIMSALYRKDLGVLHSKDSRGDVLNLSDQVYSALAAEQAYQATGNPRYLEFSVDVAGLTAKGFWDLEKGGFFDAFYASAPAGLLKDRKKPQIENAKAAALLMDLYHITGKEEYKLTAGRALAPFTSDFLKHSYWAAPFALAVERCIEPAYEFVVMGRQGSEGTAKLIKASYTYEDPDRVVVPLDPDRDRRRLEELGYEYEGKPVLYVCSDNACFPPVMPGDSMKKTREYIEKARAQEVR